VLLDERKPETEEAMDDAATQEAALVDDNA
jgi:hypothetical protein